MRFIEQFCKELDIEAPKNEKTRELIIGVVSVWAIALLGYATMWLVYGG